MGGVLIGPDDATYDAERRIWNASIDRRRALIARCAGVADVISSVRFAREHRQLVAVRSGRHSYPGLGVSEGGIVIDLGQMKGIRVDPQARTARAQAGVLLGELDREAQAFGLAVPAGIVTHTGLAGLTLGGGIGWLERKYGEARGPPAPASRPAVASQAVAAVAVWKWKEDTSKRSPTTEGSPRALGGFQSSTCFRLSRSGSAARRAFSTPS